MTDVPVAYRTFEGLKKRHASMPWSRIAACRRARRPRAERFELGIGQRMRASGV